MLAGVSLPWWHAADRAYVWCFGKQLPDRATAMSVAYTLASDSDPAPHDVATAARPGSGSDVEFEWGANDRGDPRGGTNLSTAPPSHHPANRRAGDAPAGGAGASRGRVTAWGSSWRRPESPIPWGLTDAAGVSNSAGGGPGTGTDGDEAATPRYRGGSVARDDVVLSSAASPESVAGSASSPVGLDRRFQCVARSRLVSHG